MGKKGYKHPGKKRRVVSVNPDGSVNEVFEYIKDAVAKYGMDRHSITKSCKHGNVCHGWKWFYEEDFRKIYESCQIEKLQFTLDPNRDPVTYHLKKGHKAGSGYSKLTEDQKRKRLGAVREAMKRRKENGGYEDSAKKIMKAVVCLTDGREFPSVKAASEFYGIRPNLISSCVHRVGSTHGLKFRLKSQLARIKEVI